jgi:hypothetical protein
MNESVLEGDEISPQPRRADEANLILDDVLRSIDYATPSNEINHHLDEISLVQREKGLRALRADAYMRTHHIVDPNSSFRRKWDAVQVRSSLAFD